MITLNYEKPEMMGKTMTIDRLIITVCSFSLIIMILVTCQESTSKSRSQRLHDIIQYLANSIVIVESIFNRDRD